MGVGLLGLLGASWFVYQSRTWLAPATEQFSRWLLQPQLNVATPGTRLLPGIGLTCLIFVTGTVWSWYATSYMPTDWPRRTIAAALAPALGYLGVGWVTMLAGAGGALYRPVLIVGGSAFGFLGCLLALRRSRREKPASPALPAPGPNPSLRRTAIALLLTPILIIVALTFFHALAFPVTEVDALIYHAEVARFWYLHAPSPPLVFGPSLGAEISFNYPPIFPSIGAFYYVVLGQFNDLFLRLVPPVLMCCLLTLTFAYVRRAWGDRAAVFSLYLSAGTPVLFIYGVFTTSYMLTSLLCTMAILALAHWIVSYDGWALPAASCAVALLMANSYLASYALAFELLVVILGSWRRRRDPLNLRYLAGWVLIPPMCIAGPWYLRNLISLGDPVYPLLPGVFLAKGIDSAELKRMFLATNLEIRNNALGYWSDLTGWQLRLAQIKTILSDRHLLPTTAIFVVLAVGRALRRRDPVTGVILGWIAFVCLGQLATGWFWIRTFVLVVPSAALVSGVYLSGQPGYSANTPPRPRHGLPMVTAWLTLLPACFPAIILALSGPNQTTWTTSEGAAVDYTWPWKHIGQTQARLDDVFAGDAQAWQWLKAHLKPGQRVGSLDPTTYYLRDPLDLFPLDGLEAERLGGMTHSETSRFFQSHGIAYIYVPPWVTTGPAHHPLYGREGFEQDLGGPDFPLVEAYPMPNGSIAEVFSTRPGDEPPIARAFSVGPLVSELGPGFDVAAGSQNLRLVTYFPSAGAYRLTLALSSAQPARLQFNRLLADGTWIIPDLSLQVRPGVAEMASVVLGAWPGERTYGLFAADASVRVDGLQLSYLGPTFPASLQRQTVLLPDCSQPLPPAQIQAGAQVRIMLSNAGVLRLESSPPLKLGRMDADGSVSKLAASRPSLVKDLRPGTYTLSAQQATTYSACSSAPNSVELSDAGQAMSIGEGWYPPEVDEFGGFRWMSGIGNLTLTPTGIARLALHVELTVPTEVLHDGPLKLSAQVGQTSLGSVSLPRPGQAEATFPLPSAFSEPGGIHFVLTASKVFMPGKTANGTDQRKLSIRVRRASVDEEPADNVSAEPAASYLIHFPWDGLSQTSEYGITINGSDTSAWVSPQSEASEQHWAIRADSDAPRIIVRLPPGKLACFSFDYLDVGAGRITFNLQSERGGWRKDYASFAPVGSQQWRRGVFPLTNDTGRPFVVLGPHSFDTDLQLRSLAATSTNGASCRQQ